MESQMLTNREQEVSVSGEQECQNQPQPKRERSTEDRIKEWVGKVEDLDRIRIKNVYGDRWRVDVFTKEIAENCLYNKLHISQSYFLRVDKGDIVDLTIKKEEKF